MRLKVTNEKSAWHGQEGEFVRVENGAEAPTGPDDVVVVQMAGGRAVEFRASHLSPVEAEPEADKAE